MGLFDKKKQSGYNRTPGYSGQPDDVYKREDITGYCNACGHQTSALRTTYWSGEQVTRCKSCGKANEFLEGYDSNNPNTNRPFRNDEDDQTWQQNGGNWEGGKKPHQRK